MKPKQAPTLKFDAPPKAKLGPVPEHVSLPMEDALTPAYVLILKRRKEKKS